MSFIQRSERVGRRHRYGLVLFVTRSVTVFSLTAPDTGCPSADRIR